MCLVGVRCYADSNAKLESETKRLSEVDASIKEAKESIREAAKNSDLVAYSKARENLDKLTQKREKVVFERNSAQRDVDGTKKGKLLLEEQMMQSQGYREFEALKFRKQQGEATAFVRAYSAKHKKSKPSPIFLPGEKKPSHRIAV